MPSVSTRRRLGAPVVAADDFFTAVIVGATSASPLAAGALSALYASPQTAAEDYGIGDAVDLLTQAITSTDGNPSPPPACILPTTATTPGAMGTVDVTLVTGTSVVTAHTGAHPLGTYQVRVKVETGGTIGVAGISLLGSVDDGRTWLPASALGTATTWHLYLPAATPIDTGIRFDFAAGTLVTGDEWNCPTTPPMWAAADLYSAGPPAAGAFATLAAASQGVGLIVISEPIGASDFATLVAGLDYLATFGKYPALLGRFRDPAAGESDATYVTACRTFSSAHHDERIALVAGTGRLVDAFRSYVYQRSGLAAVVARAQSVYRVRGQQGERLAQHLGWVARGPLEGFDVVVEDQIVGHDEATRGGIAGPVAGTGGMLTFYYQRRQGIKGTYVWSCPSLYPSPSDGCQTLMDQRVLGAAQQIAETMAWTAIGGALVFSPPVNGVATLDDDVRDAMATDIAGEIRTQLGGEFQNTDDPNLVDLSPTVVVIEEGKVRVSGVLHLRLYGWTSDIDLEFSATR